MPSHCICNCDMCSWAQQGKSRIWLFYDDRQILTFFGALCVKALVRQWHNLLEVRFVILDPVTSKVFDRKKILDLQNGFKFHCWWFAAAPICLFLSAIKTFNVPDRRYLELGGWVVLFLYLYLCESMGERWVGGWGLFLFNTHPFLTVHDLLRPEIYSPLAHWHQKLQRYAASLSNSLPLVLQYIIISVRNVFLFFSKQLPFNFAGSALKFQRSKLHLMPGIQLL